MPSQRFNLFEHVRTPPNPDHNPTLWEHRLRQRRPLSLNPFVNISSVPEGKSEVLDRAPAAQAGSPGLEDLQKLPSTDGSSGEELVKNKKNHDIQWGEQIPGWLNLFYDLAWTATFSSLTSNNQFREPWDSVSYVVFFIVAWWMWVSQALYNIDFYSNDWFHLLFIFLQLLVFGALAATTRGFDISNYILHSPGSSELHVYDIMTIELERYKAERLTKVSIRVITFVVALSRGLLLLQHLRVLIYAKLTSNQGRFPRRLLIVPIGLIISTGLMFGSFSITLNKAGTEPYGAKIKYALWGVAILVEMIAHVIRAQLEINQGIRLRAHGSIASRLCDITTIIIGEGINAISGTFYAILQAPGFGAPTGTGVVCCAFIIFFLVYLYFEGVAPLGNIRRRAAWVMVHLPWLLSVILLLEGVKNQLLLSSFFSTSTHLMTKIMGTLESDMGEGAGIEQVDQIMRPLLLQAGLSWEDEFARLEALYSNSTAVNSTDPNAIDANFGVWLFRVLLSTTLTSYLTFMDNGTISEETYRVIDSYQHDYNFTLEIVEELISSSLINARYIMAMCGVTFITLASLNLIQSWPRDRFQWASIFSRYAMGGSMVLLLLLNLGEIQHWMVWGDEELAKRAAVFNWVDTTWVLPTIALAYGIQFIVDTVGAADTCRSAFHG
ncbi:Bacterial low temperature requirement A protein (LtrA) [Rhizoctonia solani]|uniref:Bacterial low temperature requirement A protein (LtrA) n=1 Tax=Rhizoctonia solani TaxID=456999 RepID=A0A8H7HFC2_9AGAM|nr:Bacterial low temperature requirement A protein (LtrA) [Rhizoctonia solani]